MRQHASFNAPRAVCLLADNSFVISDCKNNVLRRVFLGKEGWTCSTVGGSSCWLHPKGMCKVDGGLSLIVCDSGHHRLRMVRIRTAENATKAARTAVVTLAGAGSRGCADGAADVCTFNQPGDVCIAADGAIIVCDTGNHKIRRIAKRKGSNMLHVTTIAGGRGTPTSGYCDGHGHSALFNNPSSIVLASSSGNILVSDSKNSCVRMLIPPSHPSEAWLVQTVAGRHTHKGHVNGICQSALFGSPAGMVRLEDGTVILCDANAHCLRVLHHEQRQHQHQHQRQHHHQQRQHTVSSWAWVGTIRLQDTEGVDSPYSDVVQVIQVIQTRYETYTQNLPILAHGFILYCMVS